MLFHCPVSYCLSEHTCRPSHTTQPRCAFGCTSRKILNTTDICLTAARGQMPAEFMRTRGSRALPTCAASRNRPIALPGELVCGRLYVRCSRPLAVLYVRSLSYIHCTRPLAVLHSRHTPARCRTLTVHAPRCRIHSLYMPARCRTFTAHARSLSYIHCTRPLAVVHSPYTPLAVVHARSLSYIHCTRQLVIVH